jgi:hypothetical protein
MRSRELEISLPCLLEVRHAMGGNAEELEGRKGGRAESMSEEEM